MGFRQPGEWEDVFPDEWERRDPGPSGGGSGKTPEGVSTTRTCLPVIAIIALTIIIFIL